MSCAEESGWSGISDAASKMFAVWVDGRELEWAREAWGRSPAAGLEGEGDCRAFRPFANRGRARDRHGHEDVHIQRERRSGANGFW